MQGAACRGEPEQQTTRRVLVIGIVLDDPGAPPGLLDFGFADVAFHSAAERVPAELELPGYQVSANFS